jgi:hypothetical protein
LLHLDCAIEKVKALFLEKWHKCRADSTPVARFSI